jgi:hypothetical protein
MNCLLQTRRLATILEFAGDRLGMEGLIRGYSGVAHGICAVNETLISIQASPSAMNWDLRNGFFAANTTTCNNCLNLQACSGGRSFDSWLSCCGCRHV